MKTFRNKKMTVKASMIFILSLAMIGCAAPSKVLIHPSTKQKANCSTWGFGFVGTPAAIALYMKCTNEHKALGYIPIEEYENKKVTEGEIVAEQPSISCMNPVWTENTEWTYSVSVKVSPSSQLLPDMAWCGLDERTR